MMMSQEECNEKLIKELQHIAYELNGIRHALEACEIHLRRVGPI